MKPDEQIRRNKVWSSNSDFFHERHCSSVSRISADNLKKGTAPARLKPHDCVVIPDLSTAPEQPSASSTLSSASSGLSQPVSTSSRPYRHQPETSDNEKKSQEINPFCTCDPCKCSPPCVCGLKKTETTTQTRWDADNQVLKHVVTDLYKPDLDTLLNGNTGTSSGQTGHTHDNNNSVAPNNSVPREEALATLDDRQSRRTHLLQNRQSSHGHEPHQSTTTVRADVHKGHQIELHTSYELYINGEPLKLHIGVMQDGQVHCHSIPNYSSASGIDVIKAIIDAFPDDYPPKNHSGES